MLGILIHEDDLADARRLIEDNPDAFNPDRIVRRCLHWWLIVFDDAQHLLAHAVAGRLIGLREFGQTEWEPKLLDDVVTAELLAALSQPKVGDLTLAEEAAMKAGYTALARRGLIGPGNAAAHQAWVTMKVERLAIARGLWTHEVIVTAQVGPNRETVRDRAVSEAHGQRKAAKMRKDIRVRYGLQARDPSLSFETNTRAIRRLMKLRVPLGRLKLTPEAVAPRLGV